MTGQSGPVRRWMAVPLCAERAVQERRTRRPSPEKSATALSPPIMLAISAEDLEDYEGRGNSPTIRQAMSAATITTARSTEPESSLEEKVTMIRVTMSEKAESRQRLDDSTPTTQVEFPPSGESALNNGNGNEGPTAKPKISLFPHKKKKSD